MKRPRPSPGRRGGPRVARPPRPDRDRAKARDRERDPGPTSSEDLAASLAEHALPAAELARVTASLAAQAERAVFADRRRPDAQVAASIKRLRGLSLADRLFVSRSLDALFRWWGWIEPLRLDPVEARLLIAVILDRPEVPEACRAWASEIGVDPRCLSPIGTAPNWGRRAEAFRRLVEQPKATTEPWALFPRWLRDELIEPPGDQPLKHRLADLLQTLQRPLPLWVRAAKGRPEALWDELRAAGVSPGVHPRLSEAAALDPSTILQSLEPFRRGELAAQDLSSLAIVSCCDADPGERWWYAGKARGERALLLSDRMAGKGTLVVGELDERKRARTARATRSGPHTNIAIRDWDGRHVVGKPGTYHGVLLEPPSSGMGLWRRDPVSRWFVDRPALDQLLQHQAQLLRAAAAGVRTAGVLIYAVPSLARSETVGQVDRFLSEHPEFQLEPFPDPLDGSPTPGTLVLWPDRADTEGWFLARMIRTRAPGPSE